MPNKPYLFCELLVLTCLSAPTFAGTVVYVSNTSQLGTLDLSTGAYQQVGPNFPDASQGLGYTANGRLVTLGFGGNLNSIDPATGVMTTIGPSGLSACLASPCPTNSANTLASFNGQTYATDFANRLYTVNTATGSATPIGLTGMPAITFLPLGINPDGTLNIYDEALFSANGKFYATFDAGYIDLSTGNPTATIDGELYQIDPASGKATVIGPTLFGLGAAVEVNGVTYAFLAATQQIATLDLTTGNTTVIGKYDANAGIISAAVATPEPATAVMTGFVLGLWGLFIYRRTPRRYTTEAKGSADLVQLDLN